MNDAVLVINVGSSSIRFAVFACPPDISTASNECLNRLYSGAVEGIDTKARLTVTRSPNGQNTAGGPVPASLDVGSHADALEAILDRLDDEASALRIMAAGHRVVHGGTAFTQAVRVDSKVLEHLKALTPLAPLHQPHALNAIEALTAQRPQLLQVACFDTAFHTDMPLREQHFALPRSMLGQGIRRYGFHGLSYEYICEVLPEFLGQAANGKIVIAHLGHGVSMCAVQNRRSVATTMSFTPLDGLPMGSRSGAIDPAVVLYLLHGGMSGAEISDVLHHRSGLLGLSGISGDMRELLSSDDPAAREAVEYFCYRVGRELGSLAAALGGLDAVIFTGGIGEHAAPVRANVCRLAAWLGIELDQRANEEHARQISMQESKVSVWVIPTDEEQVIARSTIAMLHEERGKS